MLGAFWKTCSSLPAGDRLHERDLQLEANLARGDCQAYLKAGLGWSVRARLEE